MRRIKKMKRNKTSMSQSLRMNPQASQLLLFLGILLLDLLANNLMKRKNKIQVC